MYKYVIVVCLLIAAVSVAVNAQVVGNGGQGQPFQGVQYPVRRQQTMFPFFPSWNSLMWLYFMDNGFNT